MAFPDLTDIRSRVRSLVNESSSSTFLPDTVLNRFINEAERDIAAKAGCLESINSAVTVNATRLVAFTAYKVKYVEYVPTSGNRIGLQKITLKHLGHVQMNATLPQYWTQWGSNIVLEPISGATVYTLSVTSAGYPSSSMSADTDEPLIPVSYHEDIIQYALFRALLRDRKFQQAAFVYNKYIESIQSKKQMITAQQPDSRSVIKIPDVVQNKGDK